MVPRLVTRPHNIRQYSHPHRHSIAHLAPDDGLYSVRHVGCNLDSAAHGLRVHYDRIGPGEPQPLGREAIHAEITIGVRQIHLPHALFLDPQHHDDVDVRDARFEARMSRASRELLRSRHQRLRCHDAYIRYTKRPEHFESRPRYTRVPDVTHYRNRQAVEVLLSLTSRQCIQQPLCWMRKVRLAGGQDAHMRRDIRRHELRDARLGIAAHHHVHEQRLQGEYSVQHALTL